MDVLVVGSSSLHVDGGVAVVRQASSPGSAFLSASVAAPSPLALTGRGGRAYVAGAGSVGTVMTLAIGESRVRELCRVSSEGAVPCCLLLSPDGRLLWVANYGSGTVACSRVGADGLAREPHSVVRLPDLDGRASKPHGLVLTDRRTLLMTDLGTDRIYGCPVRDDGHFAEESLFAIELPAGTGPRSIAAMDQHRFVVTGELDSTILFLRRTGDILDFAGAVPSTRNHTGNYPGGVTIDSTGTPRILNRGNDTIATLVVLPDGSLRLGGECASGGRWPMDACATAEQVFVANRDTDVVTCFRADTDMVLRPMHEISVPSPTCLWHPGSASA